MTIEIWSDIMCPFCYIGKRHLEAALAQFDHAEEVEVEWFSYQLDPSLPTNSTGQNVYDYLAERKGINRQESVAMHKHVEQMAAKAGLEYHFEKTVVANSFNAHRLIQFAKTQGKGNEIEEKLFRAYFTEGKDLSSIDTLTEIGKELGLDSRSVLESDQYADEVRRDIHYANQLGVRGVPFFLFERRYAVSGAQPVETFLEVLNRVYGESR